MKDEKGGVEVLSLPQQRYVETIGELLRDRGEARMTDVAGRISVSLPSASEAVKRLVAIGVVSRRSDQGLNLTKDGWRIADQLERRHQSLKRFMVDVMAMSPRQADAVACRVEHCVDREFAERLMDVARFLEEEYPDSLAGIATYVRDRRSTVEATG